VKAWTLNINLNMKRSNV